MFGVNDLMMAAKDMWGNVDKVKKTKIKGIFDVCTEGHGGYLVDITVHDELKNYGFETNIENLRAFEEDYEALKVLWLFPELIRNTKNT